MQLDPVTIQILWNRLITIVDEAATGLMRTAYTPSVKEYHDFCCALFDTNAQMLSHSTVTTAGFLGIVPEVMRNFLKKHPPESLQPGDAIITNDPWIASGHLIDISIASPISAMAKPETIEHRVGLLIPSSNTNVEPVYNSVMPSSISVHAARLAMTEVSKHVFPRQGRTFDTGSGSSPT